MNFNDILIFLTDHNLIGAAIIFVVFIPFSIFLLFAMKDQARSYIKWETALKRTADDLGLRFTDKSRNFSGYIPASAVVKRNYLFRSITFSLSLTDLKVSGIYNGIGISVDFENIGRGVESLNIKAIFPFLLPANISVHRKTSLLNSIIKRIEKKNIVEKDTDIFDYLKIESSDMNNAIMIVERPAVKESLSNLFYKFQKSDITVTEEMIRYSRKIYMNIDNPSDFKKIISALSNSANEIYNGII